MKIIIDPEFPNPEPYVDIIHAVKDRYLDRLMHKSILLGKLETLKLYLNLRTPNPEDYAQLEEQQERILSMGDTVPEIIRNATMEQTVYDRLYSTGNHCVCIEEGQIFSTISLDIRPDESHMQVANIVAIMLGHLLLDESMDFIHLGRMAESGTIPAGSSIARKKPKNNAVYGRYMESAIVNTIADYVISGMGLLDHNEVYSDVAASRDYEHSEVAMCRLFASAFGDPLEDCRYIDEFEYLTEEGFPEEEDYDLLEPLYDDYGESLPWRYRHSYSVRNPFWYCVVTNAFECITAIYNSHMGENAYELFCSLWEKEQCTTEDFEQMMLGKIQMERFVNTIQKHRQK